MHAHATTPPTPIPVMITAPEDSPSRRGSTSLPPIEPRRKFATFYTLDEVNLRNYSETSEETFMDKYDFKFQDL